MRNRDGSYNSQGGRLRTLELMSRELRELSIRHIRADLLKFKHVTTLVASGQHYRRGLGRVLVGWMIKRQMADYPKCRPFR